MPLDGSEQIEAKPWQDRGYAHLVKVLSFSILSILMCCWWERGDLALSLISTCLFMHVSNICRSWFHHLGNLSTITKYVTKGSVAVVVHALLRSKLDYCNALLYGLPKYQSQRLQWCMYKIGRLELCCKWRAFSISHLSWASFTGCPFNTVLFSRFCFECINHWMGHRLAI